MSGRAGRKCGLGEALRASWAAIGELIIYQHAAPSGKRQSVPPQQMQGLWCVCPYFRPARERAREERDA